MRTIKHLLSIATACLVAALTLAACGSDDSGSGEPPELPADAVAAVGDVGVVTQAEFDQAKQQTLAAVGLEEAPAAEDPTFDAFQLQALQPLVQELWIRGEAQERDVTATDEEISEAIGETRSTFAATGDGDEEASPAKTERAFTKAAENAGLCSEEELGSDTPAEQCQGVVDFHEVQILSNKLVEDILGEIEVTDEDVDEYFAENEELFAIPATRVARVILNEKRGEVEKAMKDLSGLTPESDGFGKAWQSAAKQYSQDEASRSQGGLLTGVVEGQGDPGLDEQIFSLGIGEQSEIFETPRGFYFIQVVSEKPEGQNELTEDLRTAIRQTVEGQKQQEIQADFSTDFQERWQSVTACAPEVTLFPLCAGTEDPAAEAEAAAEADGADGNDAEGAAPAPDADASGEGAAPAPEDSAPATP